MKKDEFDVPVFRNRFKFLMRLCSLVILISFAAAPFSSLLAQQQNREITGTVTDSKGQPVVGASVAVPGTTTGTNTDANGKFRLSVQGNTTSLSFTFMGLKQQVVEITGKTTISITMENETLGLGEVVVVGYGTQKKRDLTGAISSIKASEIKTLPVTNSTEALQGKAAGVEVTQTGGRPGSDWSIRIRGNRSLNTSVTGEPLYVVDGIPLDNINLINPADIETMDILKDASSTAIFGFRGSNGVIIITTKRGKSNQAPTFSYEGYVGIMTPSFRYDLMNGTEFKAMKDEANRAAGLPVGNGYDQVELDMIAAGTYTDWQKLVTQNGIKQSHQINMSGGSENTQYSVTAGLYNEQGLLKTDMFRRYSFRVNFDQKINNFLKLGISTFLVRNEQNIPSNDAYTTASNLNPLSKPYDANGNLLYYTTSDLRRSINPLIYIADGSRYLNKSFENELFSNIFAEITPFKWLNYRINFAPQINGRRIEYFDATATYQQANLPSNGSYDNSDKLQYNLDNIITIQQNWNNVHNLNVTLLQSAQSVNRNEIYNSFTGINIRSLQVEGLNPQTSTMGGYYTSYIPSRILSYMGRVNYGFKSKYLLTLAVRADGASVLSSGRQWDYFPSAAVAWNISEESFLKNIKVINNLKLRFSYGLVGNASVPPYTTLGTLKTTNYAWDETLAAGFAFNTLPNKKLFWEKTETYNAGIDFSILKNRVSGVIEGYIGNTFDILLNRQPIPSSGYTSTTVNLGKVQNKGIEFTLNTVIIDNTKLKWTADFTFSSNAEKIVDLYGDKKSDVGNRWFIGHPINSFYDYRKIGIWQTGEEADALAAANEKPGDIRVQNVDTARAITAADMQVLGSPNPKFSTGLNTKIEFMGFDLSVFLYARSGGMISSSLVTAGGGDLLNTRTNNYDMDYWTPENPTNAYPRPFYYQSNFPFYSTLRYWDASFIKVRNITLGYNTPKTINDKLHLKSLRIYITVQNPFRWSKYPYDPEALPTFDKSNELYNGMVGAGIPTPRTFLAGFNVSF